MPNLLALREGLRSSIGNPLPSDVSDPKLNGFINDAYERISTRFRFHKTRKICILTTVNGSYRYNLPADATVVMRVKDLTNHRRLVPVGDRDESDYTRRDSFTGQPEKYIRYRGFLEFTPTPDGAYRLEVRYKAAIAPLVDDADTPVVPSSWHHGIKLLAKHLYYDDQGDAAKAVMAYDSYKVWLEDQPVEVDEEKRSMDQAVAIPAWQRRHRGTPRDWDDEEW